MSATSSALAPARTGTFTRRTRTSTKVIIASMAVAGAVALGAAVVVVSGRSSAPLAARGGFGHVAPITSAYDNAFETRSVAAVAAGAAEPAGPSSLVIKSGVNGLNVRVPAVDSTTVQAIDSRLGAVDAPPSAAVVISAGGFNHRLLLP